MLQALVMPVDPDDAHDKVHIVESTAISSTVNAGSNDPTTSDPAAVRTS